MGIPLLLPSGGTLAISLDRIAPFGASQTLIHEHQGGRADLFELFGVLRGTDLLAHFRKNGLLFHPGDFLGDGDRITRLILYNQDRQSQIDRIPHGIDPGSFLGE